MLKKRIQNRTITHQKGAMPIEKTDEKILSYNILKDEKAMCKVVETVRSLMKSEESIHGDRWFVGFPGKLHKLDDALERVKAGKAGWRDIRLIEKSATLIMAIFDHAHAPYQEPKGSLVEEVKPVARILYANMFRMEDIIDKILLTNGITSLMKLRQEFLERTAYEKNFQDRVEFKGYVEGYLKEAGASSKEKNMVETALSAEGCIRSAAKGCFVTEYLD